MGIGEGCSRIFFEAGSNVVIFDKNPTVGEQLIKELNQRAQDLPGT
jgi:NAD(P)-dependent dehydrogenase (short-subunit alcohol dehydrogenase family)